jgi:hypothetical protein
MIDKWKLRAFTLITVLVGVSIWQTVQAPMGIDWAWINWLGVGYITLILVFLYDLGKDQ